MNRQLCLVALLSWYSAVSAGIILKDTFVSSVLKKTMAYNVYLPATYLQEIARGVKYPVVYLLHGHSGASSGNADMWHLGIPNIGNPTMNKVVDSVKMICVAPDDGVGFSWWMNSPIIPSWKYSTYLATELKQRIDSLFSTIPDRNHHLLKIIKGAINYE